MVVAYHKNGNVKPAAQILAHEILCRHFGKRKSEIKYGTIIDAGLAKQRATLVEIGKQLLERSGTKNLRRMTGKSHRHRLAAAPACRILRLRKQKTVAAMYTVEKSYGGNNLAGGRKTIFAQYDHIIGLSRKKFHPITAGNRMERIHTCTAGG